jgi:hypothetical protein
LEYSRAEADPPTLAFKGRDAVRLARLNDEKCRCKNVKDLENLFCLRKNDSIGSFYE